MASTELRAAAQQALEALCCVRDMVAHPDNLEFIDKQTTALRAALAEPVQEPVAGRAFLERILTAMEGVIDVADRKTDEFDALRSCVIDLTMLLHTAPPQRKPLSVTDLQDALVYANLIDRDAIDDADNYDEGSTLAQIDALHRFIYGITP